MPWPRTLTAAVLVTLATAIAPGVADAAPSRPAAPATTTRPIRYVVRAGDSFAGIAARFGVSPSTLAKANRMRLTTVVHPGKVLTVPVRVPANLPKKLPAPLVANPDRLGLYPLF